jgi:hypothetical protein
MSAEQWKFYYGPGAGTLFTSDVLSFSGNQGRQNYIDNYAGGSFNITIKNQSNQAANFTRGTSVSINFSTGNVFVQGKVIGITYSDYPGNTGLSTATITCQDPLLEAGKWSLQDFTGYYGDWTTYQARYTNQTYTGWLTPEVLAVGQGLSRAEQVTNYNGTILNRLNLLNNAERGQLVSVGPGIYFLSRSSALNVNTVSFHRSTSSATSIAYTAFRRINSLDTFMNQITVNSYTMAGASILTFGNNTDSQTAYGTSGYTVNTADIGTYQPSGLASWLAYVQGDPALLRFEIDFDDATASSTAIFGFLYGATISTARSTSATWCVPGAGSNTTTNVMFEGFSFSGTPSKTSYTAYFSSLSVYQYFILDSSTQGILDTSRLAWGY